MLYCDDVIVTEIIANVVIRKIRLRQFIRSESFR